ncbi:RNA-processing protein [Candidatus Woesearchaeota archaeon]|nr:RNA-processing protein [Candidatus Woesearchaeota archaeon]
MTPSPPPVDETATPPPREPAIPEFSYELKIPKDRIAVLIGPKGLMKKELEEQTKTSIKVDSKEGDVRLFGKDSLALFSLREVVKAIGRGFNPEVAILLLKQDYVIEIIDVSEYSRQKSHLQRLRGRVIGADGKARVTIENLTETSIVVYGKTISVIGTTERSMLARRAVEALLDGSTHASVYKWLEKAAKRLRKKEGFQL